ncbi:MAG: carbohydrate kinase family protein [Myxococcota bacterium]
MSQAGSSGPALWSAPERRFDLDVLGLGENSLDTLCVVERMPRPGESLAALRWLLSPGGQVASAVLACARLGLRSAYAGAVGDDPAAEVILQPLKDAGVDLGCVRSVAGATSRSAVILVERSSGERSVLGFRDPRLALRPGDLDESALGRARVLHLDAVDPDASAWAARRAGEAGVAVVLDADAAAPGIEALLPLVDFPIVSRSFAEEWGGTGSVRDGLDAVTGPRTRLAVATLGADGALARSRQGWIETAACEVAVTDTTGAGDAFHAGFIWGLLQGRDASGVLRAAHAVAALNCTALGAQDGLPGVEDLLRFERGERVRSGPADRR